LIVKDYIEKNIIFLLLAVISVVLIYFAVGSEGSWGGADSLVHYRISRYAFDYPHLFLNYWGKPLFTVLSAPFSQFGFTGLKLFNVILGVLSAYYTHLITKRLNLDFSYLAIIFLCFAPMYFVTVTSTLTEVLFGFIMILSIYFILNEKYILAAIIVSFLPFARSEGFIIIPLFAIIFVLLKRYKMIPLLLTGFTFYSVIGWRHYNDLFWVINKNPYKGAFEIYGHGEFLHFVKHYSEIIGAPIAVLFLFGILFLLLNLYKGRGHKYITEEIILIYGGVFIYVLAHSVLWWQGLKGSLGLTRVMAGIIPLIAIISVNGVNLFKPIYKRNKIVKLLFVLGLIILVVAVPFKQYSLPVELSQQQKLYKKSILWICENGYDDNIIYYYDPFCPHILGVDPFDGSKVREAHVELDRMHLDEKMPLNSIYIWDAHFGPNEGRAPLESVLNNDHLKLLIAFKPEKKFQVLGGYDYEIYVFQKIAASKR